MFFHKLPEHRLSFGSEQNLASNMSEKYDGLK
jgi:hypothetical protein